MPTYEPFDWYRTPVYYDIIFDTDTEKEAIFLEQCHGLHAADTQPGKPLSVLEPACGSGRLMAELASRGHHVAGVDLSQGMLDFAKKRFKERGVKGKLVEAPMQDFDLHRFPAKRCGSAAPNASSDSGGGFDLAHILVSSFKYLQTEEDAVSCLTCICDHLRVGGVFVLGIHTTEPDFAERSLERWRAQRDGLDVICTIRSDPPNFETRTEQLRSRIVARPHPRNVSSTAAGETAMRYETNWTFRTYTPNQLKSMLRKEPRLRLEKTYTFHHDINKPTTLDGDDLGVVLVLRREK